MDRNQSRLRRAITRRQNDAMIEQFSGPPAEPSELLAWRRIRRAAVSRKLRSEEMRLP